MSIFCSTECGRKNPLCTSYEYYRSQYRVDRNGRPLPVSPYRLAMIDTIIVGNLVFSSNGRGLVFSDSYFRERKPF
ncbi:MAG: hypothetical protein MRZ91_04350 [Christensenellaceae bacterium]|nr:hypothetical protein [Christensenellaceae bacterium]MDD6927167.1 hypothetical protein [bacterium]MDY2851885.1 hypothetical protein [Christensenellaceae bacterium]